MHDQGHASQTSKLAHSTRHDAARTRTPCPDDRVQVGLAEHMGGCKKKDSEQNRERLHGGLAMEGRGWPRAETEVKKVRKMYGGQWP